MCVAAFKYNHILKLKGHPMKLFDTVALVEDYQLKTIFLQTYCKYIGYLLFLTPQKLLSPRRIVYNISMKNKTDSQIQKQPDTLENRKKLSKCKDVYAKLVHIKYAKHEENRDTSLQMINRKIKFSPK